MRALYASGRQHDALAAYQRARVVLGDEFGLEPGRELRALEQRILEQDPTLIGPGNRAALPAPLRDDTPLVGRQHELAWLAASWRASGHRSSPRRTRAERFGTDAARRRVGRRGDQRRGSVEYVSGRAGLHLLTDGPAPARSSTPSASAVESAAPPCRRRRGVDAACEHRRDPRAWRPPRSAEAAARADRSQRRGAGHPADPRVGELVHRHARPRADVRRRDRRAHRRRGR